VVRRIAGDLYAGTLGKGLFRLGEAGWAPVSDGDLPGLFITSLAEDASRRQLLIGTMNRGVVILDLAAGTMTDLADLVPDFTSANVTSVLAASDGRVWIGTYGEGLVVWAPQTGAMTRYTKAGGQIGDDWVLCSAETDRGLYFGTFGGGVSFLSRSGTWRRIGIGDGLASLDVTAIEWRPPWLYFGTLGAGVSVYDEASDGAQP
jgi:ligand-binding sensor domain-containing protein